MNTAMNIAMDAFEIIDKHPKLLIAGFFLLALFGVGA